MRTALLGAPYALTLPSGAALANTSTYQCIASNRRQVDNGSAAEAITFSEEETPDWVRVVVPEHNCKVTYEVTVVARDADNNIIYETNPDGTNKKDADGNDIPVTDTVEVEVYRKRYLLPHPYDEKLRNGEDGDVYSDNLFVYDSVNKKLVFMLLDEAYGSDDPTPEGTDPTIKYISVLSETGTKVRALAWLDTNEPQSFADGDASVIPLNIHPNYLLAPDDFGTYGTDDQGFEIGTAEGDPTPLNESCYCSINPNISGICAP